MYENRFIIEANIVCSLQNRPPRQVTAITKTSCYPKLHINNFTVISVFFKRRGDQYKRKLILGRSGVGCIRKILYWKRVAHVRWGERFCVMVIKIVIDV